MIDIPALAPGRAWTFAMKPATAFEKIGRGCRQMIVPVPAGHVQPNSLTADIAIPLDRTRVSVMPLGEPPDTFCTTSIGRFLFISIVWPPMVAIFTDTLRATLRATVTC